MPSRQPTVTPTVMPPTLATAPRRIEVYAGVQAPGSIMQGQLTAGLQPDLYLTQELNELGNVVYSELHPDAMLSCV